MKDYLRLHFIVVLFGFTGILGLLISVHPLSLVFFRTLLAALGIGVLYLVHRQSLLVARKAQLQMLGVGVIIAIHWLLFFGSGRVANVSISLAGFATTSFFTALIEPLFTKRPIRRLDLLMSGIILAGLYLIFFFEFDHFLGLIMSIASAVGAAIFTTLNGSLVRQGHQPLIITFYEMVGACLTTAVFLLIYSQTNDIAFVPTTYDWLWLLILSLVCTVYGHATGTALMKRFSAFTVNLAVNLEPVYGIILAFFIFGQTERMTWGFYVGTVVILAVVLSYPFLSKKFDK
jgi:drug/metabolite transporter (DMT)-like permease